MTAARVLEAARQLEEARVRLELAEDRVEQCRREWSAAAIALYNAQLATAGAASFPVPPGHEE